MRYRNKKTRGGAVQQNHVQDVNPRANLYINLFAYRTYYKIL